MAGRFAYGVIALLAAIAAYLCLWPVPVEPVAWEAPADRGLQGPLAANELLRSAELIELAPHHGPEDLTPGYDGRLFTVTEAGKILSMQTDGSELQVFADTGGRPLGIEFAGGSLYVANAYLGLQRIRRDGRVISVVSEFDGKPIAYADDVAVAANGMVYFSDASSKFAASQWGGTYQASLLDIMEHGGHGRILKYDPFSNETSLVMENLNFANGIAISEDQRYLLVSETGHYRIWRHWLVGPDAGRSEVIIENLPAFPDNINNGYDGRFWIGLIAPRSAILDRFSGAPFIRKLMQRLPAALRPSAQPWSQVIAIDGDGRILANLHDSSATFPAVTGAVETSQYLYLTSLFGQHLARLDKRNLP